MADAKKKPPEANMVELASILFLAALFVGVLMPGFGQVQKRAKDRADLAQCRANLTRIHEALDHYARRHERRYPKNLQELVSAKILAALPSCPAAQQRDPIPYDDKGYKVKLTDPYRYTIMCLGNYHADAGMGMNEPYYDSLYGMKPAAVSGGE